MVAFKINTEHNFGAFHLSKMHECFKISVSLRYVACKHSLQRDPSLSSSTRREGCDPVNTAARIRRKLCLGNLRELLGEGRTWASLNDEVTVNMQCNVAMVVPRTDPHAVDHTPATKGFRDIFQKLVQIQGNGRSEQYGHFPVIQRSWKVVEVSWMWMCFIFYFIYIYI